MGRAKIAMEFISKEKTRNITYRKRINGLMKKGHELSILCNVPVCIIIYPYKEGKQSLEAEVYTFTPNNSSESANAIDLDRAKDPKIATEIIDRYLRVPKAEKNKRALNLCDMFDEWKRRADQELSKLRHKNALVKFQSWDSSFDEFNLDQLMKLLIHLDQKIEYVKQRISIINDTNHTQTTALVPLFEPTPISGLLISDENNIVEHHHQMGYPNVEVYNHKFPLFNYPISNINKHNKSNNHHHHQEYCHQIVPFNPNSFSDQVGATRFDDHHGGSNSNMVMYNMNVMAGMGPMYYDQRPGVVDNIGSYGAGLPMSMPLQLPVLPNVSLPRQKNQYQMLYE